MKISQAILPVAGLGTRFLPWTKAVPKELLPLGTQPIIAILVDECLENGITDICFVISSGKEAIPAYFTKDTALEDKLSARGKPDLLETLSRYDSVRFHTVYQEEQLGDGHAILQAADWVDSDTLAVLFGDDLFTGANTGLSQLKKAYETINDPTASFLALEDVPRERVHRYGIVEVESEQGEDGRLKKIKNLVEKPEPEDAPSTLGIVGRFLIPRSLLDVLPNVKAGKGSEIRLVDAFIQERETMPIYGYECEGQRIDTGTPEGYREAVKIWD
jgi:UTP--glucose-1-phosphate uridylyltransferase